MSSQFGMDEAKVYQCDMSEEMLESAIEQCRNVCESSHEYHTMAENLKNSMDVMYGEGWQCIIGSQYGSSIAYERGTFLDVVYRDRAILLFKAADTKDDD